LPAAHPAPHSLPTRRSSDLHLHAGHNRIAIFQVRQTRQPMWLVSKRTGQIETVIESVQDMRPGSALFTIEVECRGLLHKADNQRSEEHTSELQSRENLVCRL